MLNALHPAYLAKVMAAQLNARFDKKGEKAAMIFVSSAASFMPSPGNLIYSASKIFTSYIAEGLFYEFEGKVDVINYMPSSVDTNMNPSEKVGSKTGYITPMEAVVTSLRDLGNEPSTYGHHSHENTINVLRMFPKPMMSRASIKGTNEYHAKLEAEEAKKAA
jgi:short-subunit dehydrogenase